MAKDDKFLGTKTLPAAKDFAGDMLKTTGRLLSKPVRLLGGVGGAGKGVGQATLEGGKNILQRADNVAAGALRNPVTKPILMVAAAVAIYHGIKRSLGINRKKKETEAINKQAAAVEAQNAQMVQDYRKYQFENEKAQGGHLNRYQQQGADQTVQHTR